MDQDPEDPGLVDAIKQQVDEWSSNSNECFTIELVRGDGSVSASFQPDFTYPIFGEEEALFGYQALSITLAFASHNLRPHLSVSYDKKYPKQGEVEPTDIQAALEDFLSESAFSSSPKAESLRDGQAKQFVPPGEKISEYERDGEQYEIWCASLADDAARALLENMQVLVPMFIEGGTMLQLEQDWTTRRWALFLLYQVDTDPSSDPSYSRYSLCGYATSYRVFTFPDRQASDKTDLELFAPSSQPLDDFLPPLDSPIPNNLAPTAMPSGVDSPLKLPSRERLSQFLILPPFQGSGHGRALYSAMYTHLTSASNIREFTVEDPNEAFDDLRDFCDLLHLRAAVPDFAALRINPSVPTSDLAATARIPTDLIVSGPVRARLLKHSKIMPRQFDRLVEMHTLSFIPSFHRSRSRITRKARASNENDRAYYLWRLYAKQRLYLFNQDSLAQLERDERIEKLEAALDSVQEAYVKILERVETAEDRERAGAVTASATGELEAIGDGDNDDDITPRKRGSKRKVVEDADDEDAAGEEEEGEEGLEKTAGVVNGQGKKKMRVG